MNEESKKVVITKEELEMVLQSIQNWPCFQKNVKAKVRVPASNKNDIKR